MSQIPEATDEDRSRRETIQRELPPGLLLELGEGDERARTVVYARYVAQVARKVRAVLGCRRDLDEEAIVASVFRTFFRKPVISRRESETTALLSPSNGPELEAKLAMVLIGIARYKTYRELTRRSNETTLQDDPTGGPAAPIAAPSQGMIYEETLDQFNRALDAALEWQSRTLESALRSAEERVDYQKHAAGRTFAEMEVESGRNREALKKWWQRLRPKLRWPGRPRPTSGVEDDREIISGPEIDGLIEELCRELLPEHLRIVRGLRDGQTFEEIARDLDDEKMGIWTADSVREMCPHIEKAIVRALGRCVSWS